MAGLEPRRSSKSWRPGSGTQEWDPGEGFMAPVLGERGGQEGDDTEEEGGVERLTVTRGAEFAPALVRPKRWKADPEQGHGSRVDTEGDASGT